MKNQCANGGKREGLLKVKGLSQIVRFWKRKDEHLFSWTKSLRAVIAVGVLATSALPGVAVFGEDKKPAAWLSFEQGNALLARKEYGQALQQYKNAISTAGIFPEAEMAIGDVYQEEGEPDLAQRQYEKAYNLRNAFYVSESKYDVLYKLANLFEEQDLFKLMEDKLTEIVADDRHFAETETLRQRTQVEKIFFERGIDRILTLYTFDDTFATNAHSDLGWFYYRTGRYSQSVSHLLYAVIYRVSELKVFQAEKDFDFQFSTLQDLLSRVRADPGAAKYVD